MRVNILICLSILGLVLNACPDIRPVSDEKKSGYATRYWDCCKPHCAWPDNAGSNGPSRVCDFNGQVIGGGDSACDGGPATTCLSQIPFTIDGCEYGFLFAAAPGSAGNTCGKCYKLDLNIGKTLIVMATNIGWDVQGGQFDLMIPGGGVGLFNGCKNWDNSKMGAHYGGLLSECGGGNAGCLSQKCKDVFASDAQAQKGCLFLADFMGAADNPRLTYQEVECPEVLKSK